MVLDSVPAVQGQGQRHELKLTHLDKFPSKEKQKPVPWSFAFNILAKSFGLTVLSRFLPFRAGCVRLQLYRPALSRSVAIMCA